MKTTTKLMLTELLLHTVALGLTLYYYDIKLYAIIYLFATANNIQKRIQKLKDLE